MDGILTTFDVVQIVGCISGVIIMLTALVSRSLRRLPTWYLVLCSSTAYSLSMSLLAIARRQTGPEPDYTLCLVQGALIYSCPIWLLSTGLAFALQFHLTMVHFAKQYTGFIRRDSKWIPLSTVILFIALTAIFLTIGIVEPDIVERSQDHFYCHFTNRIGSYSVTGFSIVFALAAVFCEFKSASLLYQHWRQRNEFHHQSDGQVATSVMIRLAGFSLLSVLSVATCVVYVLPLTSSQIQGFIVFNAFLSNLAGPFVFGLNMSIVRAWMFWKKPTDIYKIAVEVKVEQNNSRKRSSSCATCFFSSTGTLRSSTLLSSEALLVYLLMKT
ncbi:hypothetical protein F5878DRAFT_636020 [Lentinula raphanica]|uniref:Uncharacterized protein n=1 Tax=Lentinula raphanica TaxID=153919 RepID=A0AA38NW57_9AGAR|nr:hypothetical protein F5878DRAFT_636020 [Lentinula raphanica]